MFQISREDLQAKITHLKEQARSLEVIIGPFLSDELRQKQGIELCQVGKFLTSLDNDPYIVKHSDSPDFVISYNNRLIGLEHERIFIADEVEKIQSLKKLFDDAARDFEMIYPNHRLLANCWLTDNNFSFRKKETKGLRKAIVDYIYSIVSQKQADKPSFIEEVRVMKHSQVAFCYNAGAHYAKDLDTNTLKKAMLKKDPLVDSYRLNSNLEEQWLLIVTGSASKDSYEVNERLIEKGLKSKFNRVYLLDDFAGNVFRIV